MNKQKNQPKAGKKPTAQIEDTGERMVPAVHKGKWLYGEHIVRYEATLPLVREKVVLDIASGTGYGSKIMAHIAKKVYGIDYDQDAINYAKENYRADNIEYRQGNGTDIPLGDNTVDVVVTVETIEHIEDYTRFLDELRRVLKDDGELIISSPNKLESPKGNHFHLHEFKHNEFTTLLEKNFKKITPYFQGTWLYNALVSKDLLESEWRQDIDTINVAPISIPQTMYYLYVCSNGTNDHSLKPLGAISEHYSVKKVIENEQNMRKHMDEQRKVIDHIADQLKQSEAQAAYSLDRLNILEKTITYRTIRKLRNIFKGKR